MATKALATIPPVMAGRRTSPLACDCCNKQVEFGGYHWTEIEVGPASFAWAVCNECVASGASKEMHWTQKALTRAKRHGRGWAKAVERMILDSIQ